MVLDLTADFNERQLVGFAQWTVDASQAGQVIFDSRDLDVVGVQVGQDSTDLIETGYEFGHNDDYARTGHYVKEGTLIYDDVTAYELDKFIEAVRPDLVGSGIKEKYPVQKLGIPFRQMHSWDYSGPYHGYDGFAIFARDMDLAINNPVWGLFKAPWKQEAIAAE